jgi:hypothetical protein
MSVEKGRQFAPQPEGDGELPEEVLEQASQRDGFTLPEIDVSLLTPLQHELSQKLADAKNHEDIAQLVTLAQLHAAELDLRANSQEEQLFINLWLIVFITGTGLFWFHILRNETSVALTSASIFGVVLLLEVLIRKAAAHKKRAEHQSEILGEEAALMPFPSQTHIERTVHDLLSKLDLGEYIPADFNELRTELLEFGAQQNWLNKSK